MSVRVVDLFAGWGGFSIGAEAAGASVLVAANHWPLAVEAHRLNHPGTRHDCQDLRQMDWRTLPEFDLLVASPACQGHSQASQPKRRAHHDALRATAFAVVDCLDQCEPAAAVVENVLDFERWRLFPHWRQMIEALGYRVQLHRVWATAHGVPQRRRRLFVTATKGDAIEVVERPSGPEPAFGPCVDWEDRAPWRRVSEASGAVQKRIAAGRDRCGRRFVTQHVTGNRGFKLSEAVRTVTCQDQLAVVDGERYRPLTVRETARAMGFPETYGWPPHSSRRDQITGLGNAVPPPVASHLVSRAAQSVGLRTQDHHSREQGDES